MLEAPAGASDECHRHAKRNVLTFSTHAAPSFQVGNVPQQTLDDERRQHCLVGGVVNHGHHHIASLSYAMKGTLNGLTSLQKEKKTRSPSNRESRCWLSNSRWLSPHLRRGHHNFCERVDLEMSSSETRLEEIREFLARSGLDAARGNVHRTRRTANLNKTAKVRARPVEFVHLVHEHIWSDALWNGELSRLN